MSNMKPGKVFIRKKDFMFSIFVMVRRIFDYRNSHDTLLLLVPSLKCGLVVRRKCFRKVIFVKFYIE